MFTIPNPSSHLAPLWPPYSPLCINFTFFCTFHSTSAPIFPENLRYDLTLYQPDASISLNLDCYMSSGYNKRIILSILMLTPNCTYQSNFSFDFDDIICIFKFHCEVQGFGHQSEFCLPSWNHHSWNSELFGKNCARRVLAWAVAFVTYLTTFAWTVTNNRITLRFRNFGCCFYYFGVRWDM